MSSRQGGSKNHESPPPRPAASFLLFLPLARSYSGPCGAYGKEEDGTIGARIGAALKLESIKVNCVALSDAHYPYLEHGRERTAADIGATMSRRFAREAARTRMGIHLTRALLTTFSRPTLFPLRTSRPFSHLVELNRFTSNYNKHR